MAVTAAYLTKIRRAVRVNADTDFDAELTDIIDECRQDLMALGVSPSKAYDEADSLVLGAVRSFARWKFGLDVKDAALNREDYMMQRDEMRRRTDYIKEAEEEE